jgi:DNA-binding CsgD family transcriptional regulator
VTAIVTIEGARRIPHMDYPGKISGVVRSRPSLALLDVVDHLYAAILEPARLRDALGAFATLLDARAAGVRVETVGVGVRQEWVGLEPSFDRAYVEHYWRDDPWAARIWDQPVGAVGHGDALAPRAVLEASAFHNELARPSGFDDLLGGLLERTSTRVVTFGVMKGAGSRRFDGEADTLASALVPHLARSLALRDRIAALEAKSLEANRVAPSVVSARAMTARLVTLYGLTAAEARVAVGVGRGLSPKEIAVAHGCSWHTVRAQLRLVFAKTETRTQSALARLVTLREAELAAEEALNGRR